MAGEVKKRKGGRPPGRRNNKTLMKDDILRDIAKQGRALMALEVEGVIRQVTKQALEGCRASQKLIMDRMVPVPRNLDADNAAPRIVINIGGLTDGEGYPDRGQAAGAIEGVAHWPEAGNPDDASGDREA